MTEAVEGWRRNLRFQLARASGSERPRLIREALVEAHPLVDAGKVRRQDVLDIAEAAAREHGITSLKPASPAGFFQSLNDDDGPRAA
jgi:hypothetical protein